MKSFAKVLFFGLGVLVVAAVLAHFGAGAPVLLGLGLALLVGLLAIGSIATLAATVVGILGFVGLAVGLVVLVAVVPVLVPLVILLAPVVLLLAVIGGIISACA
jgi:hypothetical protein